MFVEVRQSEFNEVQNPKSEIRNPKPRLSFGCFSAQSPARLLPLTTLIISTRNAHKVAEIQSILGPAFRCQAVSHLEGAPEVVEDRTTFAGNATKKAVELANWLASLANLQIPRPQFVLADDSGLEVDALNGAPGVYSARFAVLDGGLPGNSATAANNAKLLRLLENVPADKRTARFRCVIALSPLSETARSVSEAGIEELESRTKLFEGACEGRIGFAPRGKGGFGYDPLFFPTGYEQSFAELGEEIKNHLSHRARALEQLKRWLSGHDAGPQKR